MNGECSQNSEREIICNENSERKIRKRQERCTGIPLTPPLQRNIDFFCVVNWLLYKFQIDSSTNSQVIKYLKNMGIYAFYMLNVTRQNYVLDDFMRNSNFRIGVLHVKVKYWRIVLVTSFLWSLKFLLFHRIRVSKEVSMEKRHISMAQCLRYDCTC